jgi:7,8-dihydroneopterin aldolase/epimerase/oxygenase
MMYIHLHKLRFHSFHGLYDEERILGNDYEVDVSVGLMPRELPVQHIDETLDYTALYSLVKKRMLVATPLLETLATEIAAEIESTYSQVTKISISIKKLYPPVNNFEGSVGVSFEWNK